MHRSGTSLCSHILSALGMDMSDDIDVNPSNARGHWERREIVEFHDRILSLFNRDYLGRFHDFALPVAWWADPRVAQIRREIVAFLEQRMGEGYFGLKDPRTVRLMPVWHQVFNELKLAPRVVLCLRNPAQVARSLHARDGLDPEIGEYRWLVHMIDFFRYASNFDFCTVEYEEWFNNPSVNIEKLQKFLDLPWQQSGADLHLLLSGIIDPTARHDDTNYREAGQPLVRTLYKLAGGDGQDGARDQIAYIVSQFVSFQQLQRPLQQAFEDVARTAAKYPEIEKEATALRAAVSERGAAIAAADLRADAAEARLADALAEIDRQRSQIADLGRERDDASSLRATLAESEAALAEHLCRADELTMALRASQSELEAREAALLRAEQEAQEHAAAALARQSEIDVLRDTLAQAEREAQEHAAAAEAMQAEVGALRETLAQAEQEAQTHAVAALVRQSEIGALRETLVQAERAEKKRAATSVALEAELGELREKLARAERGEQQHAAAAVRLETELGALREKLMQAQREARQRGSAMHAEAAALWDSLGQLREEAQQREARAVAVRDELAVVRERLVQSAREKSAIEAEALEVRGKLAQAEGTAKEREAVTVALRAEIATLQDTLAAAREVGKAAIAGLRINTVAPTEPDRPHRWPPITRFFAVRTDSKEDKRTTAQ
jgi:hypothetical protein